MADNVTPPPASGPEASRGLVAELLALLSSIGRHLQALSALAGFEAKEAAGTYLSALLLLVAVLVLAIFGYAFLILCVAFILAALFSVSWIWITLGLAVAHLLAAAICGLIAKKGLEKPVFTATSAEIRRDLESLKNIKP